MAAVADKLEQMAQAVERGEWDDIFRASKGTTDRAGLLREAAQDAIDLLSSAYVEAGPDEPDKTIDALRAALATTPDEPVAGLDGRAIHAAWRDGMLMQGRDVAPERLEWDTLTQQDRDLDNWMAARLREDAG